MQQNHNNKENDHEFLNIIGSEVTLDSDGFYTPNQPNDLLLPKPQTIKELKYARKLTELPIYKPPREEPPVLFARKLFKIPQVSYYDREEAINESVKLPQVGAYKPGDVVWAICPGWSYWPALVVVDPVKKEGVQMEYVHTNKRSQPHHYYLQWLGPSMYTAWTPTYHIKPYTGWKDYYADFLAELEQMPNLDDKIRKIKKERIREGNEKDSKAKSKSTNLSNWRESISEADVAMGLAHERRLELLTYEYV